MGRRLRAHSSASWEDANRSDVLLAARDSSRIAGFCSTWSKCWICWDAANVVSKVGSNRRCVACGRCNKTQPLVPSAKGPRRLLARLSGVGGRVTSLKIGLCIVDSTCCLTGLTRCHYSMSMRKQRQEDASEEKVGELTISYFRSEVYPFHLKHVPTLEAGVAFAGKTCQRSPFFHCTYDQSVFPLVQRLILSAYDDEASIDFRVFEANRGGKLLESPV